MNDINIKPFNEDELIASIINLVPDLKDKQCLIVKAVSIKTINNILSNFIGGEVNIMIDPNGADIDYGGEFESQGSLYEYWGSGFDGTLCIQIKV